MVFICSFYVYESGIVRFLMSKFAFSVIGHTLRKYEQLPNRTFFSEEQFVNLNLHSLICFLLDYRQELNHSVMVASLKDELRNQTLQEHKIGARVIVAAYLKKYTFV